MTPLGDHQGDTYGLRQKKKAPEDCDAQAEEALAQESAQEEEALEL
jgi:hypothetical protein